MRLSLGGLFLLSLGQVLAAATGGDAVIYPDRTGALIDIYFKDYKSSNSPSLTLTAAQELFVTDGMNGIRTPIYGDLTRPAHPAAGTVVASYYEGHISTILMAKSVRPDLKIFASKKLDGRDSWPAWCKNANGVIAGQYALLLADYLQFMQARGITIDYLGVDNERRFNEGNILPALHKDIVDQLRALAAARGFTVPVLVAPEDYHPGQNNWLSSLLASNWGDRMAIYGTHYYPDVRTQQLPNLEADLRLIGGRPFWFTEPHWPSVAGQDDLDVAEDAICALWDGTDRTLSGFMWWSYARTGLRGSLMRAVSTPLIGSRPVEMDDIDGASIAINRRLQTRAFLSGDTITVYALNLSPTASYTNYGFALNSRALNGPVAYTQWTDASPATGNTGTAQSTSSTRFQLTLPARSITMFTLPCVPGPVLTVPANLTVTATAANGAVVTYAASATSPSGGVVVQLNPASGSTFPIGTTTVTATATDASGARSTATFTVTVQGVTPPAPAPTPPATGGSGGGGGGALSFGYMGVLAVLGLSRKFFRTG